MSDFVDGKFIDTPEKMQIMSAEDEKIKLIGSLLCTDSSRTILRLLLEDIMPAGEIAQKTGMPVSLVTYHLQKMRQAEMLRITKVGKNSKGHDVKYYAPTKLALVIFPQKAGDRAKDSKSLLGSLDRIYRFAIVGVASIVSALIAQNIEYEPSHAGAVYNVWQTNLVPIFVPFCVLFVGLLIEHAISRIRR